MDYYLIANTGYDHLEIGLYQNDNCLRAQKIINKDISNLFLDTIQQMLTSKNLKLEQLSFISATQGPAPLTSLRTTLATVNGIAFATSINLIGLSGIEIMLKHLANPANITVAIFNAFNKEVYFGISDKGEIKLIDSLPAIVLFEKLKQKFTKQRITFIGSAVKTYRDEIKKIFNDQDIILEKLGEPTLEILSKEAKAKFKKQLTSFQLMPIYLKQSIGNSEKCLIF